jgi:hypothetical protein
MDSKSRERGGEVRRHQIGHLNAPAPPARRPRLFFPERRGTPVVLCQGLVEVFTEILGILKADGDAEDTVSCEGPIASESLVVQAE